MNSANRLTPNSARKIHSDQKPRRLALKVSQRLRCNADNHGRGNGTPWAVTSSTRARSEEHTSELQSLTNLVCRLLLEKKKSHTTESAAKRTLVVQRADRGH